MNNITIVYLIRCCFYSIIWSIMYVCMYQRDMTGSDRTGRSSRQHKKLSYREQIAQTGTQLQSHLTASFRLIPYELPYEIP